MTLSQVPGLMPEKKLTYEHKSVSGAKEVDSRYNAGWNDAISEIGSREVELDEKKLKERIRQIFDKFREIPYQESRLSLMLTTRHADKLTEDIAIALAASLPEILRVGK